MEVCFEASSLCVEDMLIGFPPAHMYLQVYAQLRNQLLKLTRPGSRYILPPSGVHFQLQ